MEIKKADYDEIKDWVDHELQVTTEEKRPAFADRKLRKISYAMYDDQGQVIGGAAAEFHWNALHVSLLAVSEVYRIKGVGTKLIERIEQEAREHHCDMVLLETMSYQAPLFYQKLGFQVIGRIGDYPGKGECQYILQKMLNY
ncbi:MAG: GNAT family N-acetyltransferase [Sporolactobacillus sp.]